VTCGREAACYVVCLLNYNPPCSLWSLPVPRTLPTTTPLDHCFRR